MKKITIGFIIIGVIIVGSYLFIRFSALRTKEIKPAPSKEETVIGKTFDLEPSIKAKLQELIKDGSSGLYSFDADSIISDILTSKITFVNATLTPDFGVLKKLTAEHKAPDDVFKIHLRNLHIDGLGLKDIISKNNIDLKNIYIDHPIIEIYHQKSVHPKSDDADGKETVYQKLKKKIEHFAANKILLTDGEITVVYNAQKNKRTKIGNVQIQMDDILIDSTTQHDKGRFLFAKKANIFFRNYQFYSTDNVYLYKLSSVSIDAVEHSLTAKDVSLEPVGGKQQFEKKLTYNKEMYKAKVDEIKCTGIKWWKLMNNEQIIADNITFDKPEAYIYLDLSLPSKTSRTLQTFPQQMLLNMPVQADVKKINIINGKITYEEYHPKVEKSGTIDFDRINGVVTNAANMPGTIRTNRYAYFTGSGMFMHTTPLHVKFRFDLSDAKNGSFTADVNMGLLNASVINTFSAQLGSFILKRGEMKEASAHVQGNNHHASGTLSMLYNNLHITPLKDTLSDEGVQKKKSVTSLLGNILLIKNDNPKNGEQPRTADCSYDRRPDTSFFNLIFKTALTGALQIIGLPQRLANPTH